MKRMWLVLLAVSLVAVAAVFLWPDSGKQKDSIVTTPNEVSRPVRVAKPSFRTLQSSLSFHGTLSPRSRVNVIPKASGRVAQIHVKVGEQVFADQVIVELEAQEAILQCKQVQAGVDLAQANLARLQAGARPEELAQATASLDQAQASYDQASQNYNRSKTLYQEGALSLRDWEGITAQYEVAAAQLLSAQKSLDLVVQGARPEDILAATAQLAQAEASLELAKLMVEHARITVPINGTISQLPMELGSMAGPNNLVATVVDVSRVKLPLQVSGRDLVKLAKGQEVSLTLDVLPNIQVSGEIVTIAPAADQASGLFGVTLEFPNPDGLLRPGMSGTARIVVERREEVLTIPRQAVSTRLGKPGVFVVRDERAHFAPITTGMSEGDLVEVLSGISHQDNLVVAGMDGLSDLTKVQIVSGGALQ